MQWAMLTAGLQSGYQVELRDAGRLSLQSVKVQEIREDQRLLEAPLPGPCDFSDILSGWRPSQQEILLALAPGNQRLVVPVPALCHVALAGATGGGKSSLMRLLLSQLLYVGARVGLADPHFAPIDPESGEDWRPISSRLTMPPATSYTDISDMLLWLAKEELPKRLERRRAGLPVGQAFFLALDELPAIVAHVPEAPDAMAEILREGRKVGLYLVSAAQDWLVKTIGGSGGVRDCFRTAFYVGGDATSARVLLDVKGAVDDGSLGQGIVMLRSKATPKASLTRVPYASNNALEILLPYAVPVPTTSSLLNPLQFPFNDEVVEADKSTSEGALDVRTLRVREMLRKGMSQRQIIQELYGVSGGARYTEAAKEISVIIASLV